MKVAAVMDEVGNVLDEVRGLRVYRYAPNKIEVPAAIVAYPDNIEFDQTFARGMDRMTIPVVIVVGSVSARASRTKLAAYVDGDGARSIKAKLEAATYATADVVTARSVEIDTFSMAGIEYIAATFEVDVVGPGT